MAENNSTSVTENQDHPLNDLCDILVKLEQIESVHWEGLDDKTNFSLQNACDAAGTPIEKFIAKPEMQRSVLEKGGPDTTYAGLELETEQSQAESRESIRAEVNSTEQSEAKPHWEQLGMTQRDFAMAIDVSIDRERKLVQGMNSVDEALDYLGLMRDLDIENTAFNLNEAALRSLKKAQKKLKKFSVQQHNRDIAGFSRPRNLENGNDREAEQKELVRRLDALPIQDVHDAICLLVTLQRCKQTNREEKRLELLRMIQTEPVSYVNAYKYMSDRGVVQMCEKVDGASD